MKRAIGKNTLGAGKKMNIALKNYERSTHDLSRIVRTTMACGTLVPFFKEVGLTGDTFDINLEAHVLTHPTIGPLFGSFKLQLDVFTSDVRLYQGKLHNNALNIGLNMANIKLPQIDMEGNRLDWTKPINNQQINPSSIFKYLGISGIGERTAAGDAARRFNAIPWLMYADVYKNYYANKQETSGVVIHSSGAIQTVTTMQININGNISAPPKSPLTLSPPETTAIPTTLEINYTGAVPDVETILMVFTTQKVSVKTLFGTFNYGTAGKIICTDYNEEYTDLLLKSWEYKEWEGNTKPQLYKFPLENIDTMRENILAATKVTTAYIIDKNSIEPYNLALKQEGGIWSKTVSQEGLFVKTYQSDIYNNWLKTEWISGTNSINDITKIDTTGGNFTIDTLVLKRKVYNMLNAIAISGGSYDDWLDVNWSEERFSKPESPVYHGGLSKEIIFQEVISNSASEAEGGQPLGTLAGRGVLGKKHKGGYVRVKCNEPCYVMGIASITPRIDYSQGVDWDANLKNMDDFHKPALDGIGFQDLITDQMASWDTLAVNNVQNTYRSAGKQPAWLNYMTSFNRVFGNFAIESDQMFMVLNRNYEADIITKRIKDLTTYIDPEKYNQVFAYTKRDAQNFWVQIGVNMEVRRKMSAKLMPQG